MKREESVVDRDARAAKRERLRVGLAAAREKGLAAPGRRAELAPLFQAQDRLARPIAERHAASVFALLDAFPEGDAPLDVIESHVDQLSRHGEDLARLLFPTDDLYVHVLRGSATVVRRFFRWLDPGDTFVLGARTFLVGPVTEEAVGAVTAEEARLEGFRSLEAWQRGWLEKLPRSAGAATFDPRQRCFRHAFAARDEDVR